MSCEHMGNLQHAWLCGGCCWFWDWTGDHYQLIWPDDGRPTLAIPPRYAEELELVFGWGMAEVARRRRGWLGLVRQIVLVSDMAKDVA